MKKKIVNFLNKNFIRNVITMMTGAAGAQIISLILTPFIARIYGPEVYGLMGVFLATANIIKPLAALKYPIAIVLPEEDQEAKGIVRLSFIIIIITTTISMLVIFLFHGRIVRLFQLEDIALYLYFLPIVLFFVGFLEIIEQWTIRTKQFYINAKTNILRALIINGSKFGIGLYAPVAAVLIIITIVQDGVKSLLMLFFSRKSKQKFELFSGKQFSLKYLAKKYYDFPVYRAPQSFTNSLSQSIPVLLLTSLFSPASAGFYTIGRTVLNIPTNLIGKSVGDVFYPRIAEAGNKGENITQLIKKASSILALVGVIPYGIVIFFGPFLFEFILGGDWTKAGEYARWLALWMYATFVFHPSSKALPVLSAMRFHLFYTIFTIIIRLLAFVIGYYYFSNDIISIFLLSTSSALLIFIQYLITLKISKGFYKNKT